MNLRLIVFAPMLLTVLASAQVPGCSTTSQYSRPPGRSFYYSYYTTAPSSDTFHPATGAVNDINGLLGHFEGIVDEADRNFIVKGTQTVVLNPGATDSRLANTRVYLNGLDNVGNYVGAVNQGQFAFLWDGTRVAPIAYPGAVETTPTGLNDGHRISGYFQNVYGGASTGFILDPVAATPFRPVTVPGVTMQSRLSAVNQLGDVVGSYDNLGTRNVLADSGAFIYTRFNKLLYVDSSHVYNDQGQLTNCIPAVVHPLSINSFGEVVGAVTISNGLTSTIASFYYYRGYFQLLKPDYDGPITAIDDRGYLYGTAPSPIRGTYYIFTGAGSPLLTATGTLLGPGSPWYDSVNAVSLPSGTRAQGDTMYPGQTLLPGQSITSRSGRFTLLYQGDGNLVFSDNDYGIPLWASNTDNTPLGVCYMNPNGQLAIVNRFGARIFSPPGQYITGTRLIAQDDGNLVEYGPNMQVPWSTGTYARVLPIGADATGSTMRPGTVLKNGESIASPSGQYVLAFRNGFLSLSRKGSLSQLWSSSWIVPTAAEVCIMQTDGNLVLYDVNDHVTFTTHTSKNPGAYLTMQDDGNIVIYPPHGGPALWASHTVQ